MEEEEHEDLLRYSDEDSMTENEDTCLPTENNNQVFQREILQTYSLQNRAQFIWMGCLLVFSSTFLVILLPIYLETVNVKGDAYTMLHFTSFASVIVLFALIMLVKKFGTLLIDLKIGRPPIELGKMVRIGLMYGLSGFMVVYATDRKRVMCHLQDPIKGIVLVFSLVLYFFFCRKMMGLQRIFSSTTIIVGLFISVDYGLCDEFRCRGFDRERKSDDAGPWTWQTHALWAAIYITGLSIFSAHYTLLECYLVPSESCMLYTSISSTLSTISKLISNRDTVSVENRTSSSPLVTTIGTEASVHKYSALHLSLWLHVICWGLTLLLIWTGFVPSLGKASNVVEFLNYTSHGLACHFGFSLTGTVSEGSNLLSDDCGYVYIYAWLFLFVYIVYTLSSIRFLILSQSAVFTVAMTTTALPLTGIWWSVFNMTSPQNGVLLWNPSVTGELICSLLGLPIVLLGIVLLFKSHFKEIEDANNLDAECNSVTTANLT